MIAHTTVLYITHPYNGMVPTTVHYLYYLSLVPYHLYYLSVRNILHVIFRFLKTTVEQIFLKEFSRKKKTSKVMFYTNGFSLLFGGLSFSPSALSQDLEFSQLNKRSRILMKRDENVC